MNIIFKYERLLNNKAQEGTAAQAVVTKRGEVRPQTDQGQFS